MTEAEATTIPAPSLSTPGDDPSPPKAPAKKPTSANRYQLFDDGEGDYRLYEIAGSGFPTIPPGALLPIAEVPGFMSTHEARKFINNSGDRLQGKQMMILKGLEILSVDVVTVSKVSVKLKPKKPIAGPAAAGGEDGK